DRVDGLTAGHDADVERDAPGHVRKSVQRQRLMRELVDRADTRIEVDAGMCGLAGDLEAHKNPAFPAGDDGSARAAGFGVENSACAPRMPFDDLARERRAD